MLVSGAWLTVRSASTLAASFGLSRVIIGATVVAFGTSAPEFVVSLFAATRDASGLAVGNVVSSNVANVALMLGISAVVAPMTVHWRLLRWEIPVLAGVTVATVVFAADGVVERWEGVVMFAGLTAGLVTLEVDQDLFQFEIPALVLSTLVLLPLAWPRYRIARPEGALLVVIYIAFVVTVLVRS